MPRFMFDTSCMVATVQPWHVHHSRALREFDIRLDRGETLIAAAHTFAEAYAVLTRLPPPDRVPPGLAAEVLKTTFVEMADVVTLDELGYVNLLQRAPERGIFGGRIYDAIIVACAVNAGVDTLLTFNYRHFAPLAPPSLQIVVPE